MNTRVNDAWMTAIVNASSDAIISFSLDDTILSWNPGASAMFGYAADEVVGRAFSLLTPPDRADEHARVLDHLATGGNINQFESVLMRNDGQHVPVVKTISPVHDSSGAIVGAIAIMQDITERKRMEANLAFLAEVSQDLTHLTSIDETMNALGAKIGAHLGLSACIFGEIFGHDEAQITEITHGWNRADSPSLLGTYHMREFMTLEMIHMCRSSETIIIRDVFTDPKTDGAQYAAINIGSFVGVPLVRDGDWRFLLVVYHSDPHDWSKEEIALVRELTTRIWTRLERARAEEALRASERQARTLVTNLPGAATFIFDRDLRYMLADGEALYAVGKTPADYEGKQIDDAVPPTALAFMKPPLLRALDGVAFEDENVEDGIAFVSRGVPLYNDHGSVTGVLVVSYDISERKQAEVAREHAYVVEQNARVEAEAALKTRDQFLSIASHELRTPLTSLLGYASMLQSGIVNNPSLAGNMSERITRQAQRLNGLVGQLLDISRLQRGQFTITPQPLDLVAVVAQVVDAMRILASSATHPLVFTHPDEPVMVMGDAERLEQVVQNLISNAIKYTPMGGAIHVLVRMIANDALIEVTDHGIGIPEAARVQLFQPFYRASNVGTQASGFGLGLHIVQQVIERHNGRIEVESVEGDGSTFRVLLPLLST